MDMQVGGSYLQDGQIYLRNRNQELLDIFAKNTSL